MPSTCACSSVVLLVPLSHAGCVLPPTSPDVLWTTRRSFVSVLWWYRRNALSSKATQIHSHTNSIPHPSHTTGLSKPSARAVMDSKRTSHGQPPEKWVDVSFCNMTETELRQWVETNPGRVNCRDREGTTPLRAASAVADPGMTRQGSLPRVWR